MSDPRVKLDYGQGQRQLKPWQFWLLVIVGTPLMLFLGTILLSAILWGLILLSGER